MKSRVCLKYFAHGCSSTKIVTMENGIYRWSYRFQTTPLKGSIIPKNFTEVLNYSIQLQLIGKKNP